VTNRPTLFHDHQQRQAPSSRSATPHRTNLSKTRNSQMNQTQQDLIACKLRIVSQLADSLTLCSDARVIREGLRVIADTTLDSALEVRQLEAEEIPLRQVLATFRRRTDQTVG
jgi:hypothetical protein